MESNSKPNYADGDLKGWGGDPSRGAALGRGPDIRPDETQHNPKTISPKVTLQRIRLDSGGYDSLGTYWGSGPDCGRLYWYAANDSEGETILEGNLRADSREDAKRQVLRKYPCARFYN